MIKENDGPWNNSLNFDPQNPGFRITSKKVLFFTQRTPLQIQQHVTPPPNIMCTCRGNVPGHDDAWAPGQLSTPKELHQWPHLLRNLRSSHSDAENTNFPAIFIGVRDPLYPPLFEV